MSSLVSCYQIRTPLGVCFPVSVTNKKKLHRVIQIQPTFLYGFRRWREGVPLKHIEVWFYHEFHLGFSVLMTPAFINDSIDKLPKTEKDKRWPDWVKNFTAACGTEKGFFGLGNTQPFPAYQIVSNGTYKIRSYLKGNPYLTANGTLITTELIDPGDHGKVCDELVITL